jgi:hypothetical protein
MSNTKINSDTFLILNPSQDGYKKCVAMWLGVIYDSQATNRRQGGLPARAPLPRSSPAGRLGVIYDSNRPKYTKIPAITGGSSSFLVKK